MVKVKYKKEDWECIKIPKLRKSLKNYEKLNKIMFNSIIGFTYEEYKDIISKLNKGEDLVRQVLSDKVEGTF